MSIDKHVEFIYHLYYNVEKTYGFDFEIFK